MLTTVCPKSVTLKDGRSVLIRPLAREDIRILRAFFLDLSSEDCLFLRRDVRDPQVIRQWMEDIHSGRLIALVALENERIVATGRLYVMTNEWMQHVGELRLITARTYRQQGLGNLLARELVALAAERGLEKIQAQVMEDDVGAVRMCEAIGFKVEATLRGVVKDRSGKKRNLVIMVNEVAELDRVLEDWIHDSMESAYRVPGPCEG